MICEAEGRGECDDGKEGTYAYREARIIRVLTQWNIHTAPVFVCDCAKHALLLAEWPESMNKPLLRCLAVASRHINGKASARAVHATLESLYEFDTTSKSVLAIILVRAIRNVIYSVNYVTRDYASEAFRCLTDSIKDLDSDTDQVGNGLSWETRRFWQMVWQEIVT
jgi:hypothetical protein